MGIMPDRFSSTSAPKYSDPERRSVERCPAVSSDMTDIAVCRDHEWVARVDWPVGEKQAAEIALKGWWVAVKAKVVCGLCGANYAARTGATDEE